MWMTVAGNRFIARGGKQFHLGSQHARFLSASAKVWIDKDTRVICQGFTGKQVSFYRNDILLLESFLPCAHFLSRPYPAWQL
jgi:hypothetical protein